MTVTAGIDLLRGRPTPAIGTTEAKLQQRKLDALKRGVHRIADAATLPFGVHLIGVGGAGARVVEEFLRAAPEGLLDVPGSRLTALAVDIGEHDLGAVRLLAGRFDTGRAHVEALSLALPEAGLLQETLSSYRDFLKLEYPMYHPNPDAGAWLPPQAATAQPGAPLSRALAKAAYGSAYYDGDRPMASALKRFARSVEATQGDAVVCLVFGLAGGTGSGIALDLARHLSNSVFGRRMLITGIGIAPHADEALADGGASLFPVLAELDVLCDEEKNRGVTLSCGDLYKNPFTAGFVVVPQPSGADVASTRAVVNTELVSFFQHRRGANLWEALRLLNWVAAPSTQHSAARTPWGARWIHLFGCGSAHTAPLGVNLPASLGLLPGYAPEFIELRHADGDDPGATARAWAAALDEGLLPEVPTHLVSGAPSGTVQFLLPRLAKTDFELFVRARNAYDLLPVTERLAVHSLLLEQGVLLCEPSRRIEGMAGASLGDGGHWVAVPLDALRGELA